MSVKCPTCQIDNPDNQKFCVECATPLQISKDIGVTKTLETPVEKYGKLVLGTKGELMVEFQNQEFVERLSKTLIEHFEDQVFIAP